MKNIINFLYFKIFSFIKLFIYKTLNLKWYEKLCFQFLVNFNINILII